MEFRPLRAPSSQAVTDKLLAFRSGDEIVDDYLHGGVPLLAAEQNIGTTYLLTEGTDLIGYAALVFSQVQLSSGEKKQEHDMAWRSFGALRVAMIGVHQDRQRRGHGSHLLKYVEGLAATISELVSVRYLVADANPERHDWYLARGWQDNNSEAERKRTGNAISMRFDLHAPRT